MAGVIPQVPEVQREPVRAERFRARAARGVRGVMEAIVLATVAITPWVFGAVEPPAEFALYLVIAVLLALWGLRTLLEGEFQWHQCSVALCLSALFVLGVLQTLPMPRDVLAWVSPGTVRLYEHFLPGEAEVLPGDNVPPRSPAAGATLSVYPTVTHREALRLLAVLLVFVIVRNNVASRAALRRLCLVAVANGALLALFGIVQFLSSPHHMLYWTWESKGAVFGPFICRNHFPFYVNICLGLGVGLLLSLQGSAVPGTARRPGQMLQRLRAQVGDLLQHPLAPWLMLAVTLAVAGTLFSLSRGGYLALLGGGLVCLLLRWRRADGANRFSAPGGGVLLGVGLALALAIWFGFERISSRVGTLWEDNAMEQARSDLWLRGLAVIPQFPLLGAGYGTFRYLEPLQRQDASKANIYFENAHNDYLEALVEGGAVRFVLSLLAIVLLWRFGLRALRRYRGTPQEGLLLGALFGLATMLLHSFVDFGLHLPAIVLLTTVLSAQVCAAGDSDPDHPEADRAPWRVGGLAAFAAPAVLLSVGLVLCGSSWPGFLIFHLREAADRHQVEDDMTSLLEQAVLLDAAARLNPDYAHIQVRRAQVHGQIYALVVRQWRQTDRACEMAQLVIDMASGPGIDGLARRALTSAGRLSLLEAKINAVAELHLYPALQAYQRARDICPLLEEPHRGLGHYHEWLKKAEPRAVYYQRAKDVSPGIPQVWYECGVDEIDSDPDQALASWRQCLNLSGGYITPILEECKRHFKPEEIRKVLDQLLPDRAYDLITAARFFYGNDEEDPDRRALLERGLRALERQKGPLSDDDLLGKARLHRQLGQPKEALAAYRLALLRQPREPAIRLEMAYIFTEQHAYTEAERELQMVLDQQPRHAEAQALLQEVRKHIARTIK